MFTRRLKEFKLLIPILNKCEVSNNFMRIFVVSHPWWHRPVSQIFHVSGSVPNILMPVYAVDFSVLKFPATSYHCHWNYWYPRCVLQPLEESEKKLWVLCTRDPQSRWRGKNCRKVHGVVEGSRVSLLRCIENNVRAWSFCMAQWLNEIWQV